jgi:lysine 2,3-aminomutase
MNQTVLLRGINDDAATLERLFRGLVRWRVRPYYLLQADLVSGTAHFRTPLETGRMLMQRLQERLTGIALPKLVLDAPGGMGKVPLCPDYVVGRSRARTVLRTGTGTTAEYVDPP